MSFFLIALFAFIGQKLIIFLPFRGKLSIHKTFYLKKCVKI